MMQGKMLKLFHVAILFPPRRKMLQSKHFSEGMLRGQAWKTGIFIRLQIFHLIVGWLQIEKRGVIHA
jgi:hypothetical protein